MKTIAQRNTNNLDDVPWLQAIVVLSILYVFGAYSYHIYEAGLILGIFFFCMFLLCGKPDDRTDYKSSNTELEVAGDDDDDDDA